MHTCLPIKNLYSKGEYIMEQEVKKKGYPSMDRPWEKFYTKKALVSKLPENTIYGYIKEENKDNLDRVALRYYDRTFTYRELFQNIDDTAKAFLSYGVKQGDNVTIMMPTTPEAVYMIYALSKIGAVANMVDPRKSREQIEEYVKMTNSKLIVSIDVASDKLKNLKEHTNIQNIVTVSPADSLPMGLKLGYQAKEFVEEWKSKKKNYSKSGECIKWNDFLNSGKNYKGIERYPKYAKNTPLVIVHTGGTTGESKGVVLSNDNLNAAAFDCIQAGFDFQSSHNWLNIMPTFIAYGVGNGLHLPLACGMEVILIPQFDPKDFAHYMVKYRPNHMTGVPSHYGFLIDHPKLEDTSLDLFLHKLGLKKHLNSDLSYIIAPTVGGDKMDENLERNTNRYLQKHRCPYLVVKGYGLTEVTGAVSACTSNEANAIGSVGIPFPHTTISIFDPKTGEELSYGERGEVCIISPNTMLSYYENEEATKDMIRPHKDGRCWLHTGDIGYMNEDGLLFIVDRMKRMIVRHDGFKVFPSEVETVITAHPAVKACSVVGISDLDHAQGNLPKAHIVLNESFSLNTHQVCEELKALCEKYLAEYAQPVEYEIENALPLTPIGKVDYLTLEKKDAEKQKELLQTGYTKTLHL